MASIGKKTPYDQTYITSPAVTRAAVTAVDQSVELDANGAVIPDIRLDIQASSYHYSEGHTIDDNEVPKYRTAERAYNGYLELFVVYTPPDPVPPGMQVANGLVDGIVAGGETRCNAAIRVWSLVTMDGTAESEWCLVHEQSVVCNTLIVLRGIPATRYRVTVEALTAGSVVRVLEQHTE